MNERIIFHVDVNSAYLSWTAVRLLQLGNITEDIRDIPSAISGNIEDRHGIILAKSIPAKKYNLKTGENVADALNKCPHLKLYKPDYKLYMDCSNAMYSLLCEYSPQIQRYSIDEVFMDVSHFENNYMEKALEIKNRISTELGFTVNIGIGRNKLLAKMASDFEPKNSIHTLFEEEVKKKMWPLKVENLFMVGRATKKKLDNLNISTIGELANYELAILKTIFKSHGQLIKNYANGIDKSEVRRSNYLDVKGIGNSTTIAWDVTTKGEALKIILSLTELVSNRLRANKNLCKVVSISIKANNFNKFIHQKTLSNYTDSTEEIFNKISEAFSEVWNGVPIRQIGVRVTDLCNNDYLQSSLFDNKHIDKQRALDKTIDLIRKKYGDNSVVRSTFLHSGIKAVTGGVGDNDYLMMGSIL